MIELKCLQITFLLLFNVCMGKETKYNTYKAILCIRNNVSRSVAMATNPKKMACISLGPWNKGAEILLLVTHLRPKRLRLFLDHNFVLNLKIDFLIVIDANFWVKMVFLFGKIEFLI